jgi:DNA-directed RNA polymerase specialized sigma24 family protein
MRRAHFEVVKVACSNREIFTFMKTIRLFFTVGKPMSLVAHRNRWTLHWRFLMLEGGPHERLSAMLAAIHFARQDSLAEAIGDLSERERLVFTLCYYEELDTAKIARLTEETEAAVLAIHDFALLRVFSRLAEE